MKLRALCAALSAVLLGVSVGASAQATGAAPIREARPVDAGEPPAAGPRHDADDRRRDPARRFRCRRARNGRPEAFARREGPGQGTAQEGSGRDQGPDRGGRRHDRRHVPERAQRDQGAHRGEQGAGAADDSRRRRREGREPLRARERGRRAARPGAARLGRRARRARRGHQARDHRHGHRLHARELRRSGDRRRLHRRVRDGHAAGRSGAVRSRARRG